MSEAEFIQAQAAIKTLTERPSNADLLALYGLYKQATAGDASGKRPGLLDPKGRAKFDAWAALSGTSADEARRRYVARVADMLSRYRHG